jgi:hypothetical protein
MGRKHKDFPREAGESGEVRKLKDIIRRLVSDNKKLVAENVNLKDAFQKTTNFIQSKFDKIPVEEVLNLIKEKKKKKILTLDPECVKCHSIDLNILSVPGKEIHICRNCNHREVYVLST